MTKITPSFNNMIKILVLLFCCFMCFGKTVYANEIKAIRAYSDANETRIVFDLADVPKYITKSSKDEFSYEVRILQIDNPSKKYGKAEILASSVISGVSRGTRNKEVVYLFKLKKKVKPMTFALKADGNSSARLVIVFPQEVGGNVNLNENKIVKNIRDDDVRQVRNTKDLEAALFDDLNTEGDSTTPIANIETRLASPEPPKPSKATHKISQAYVIVIDPGHGGKDPGAIGKHGLQEKKVTLGISQKILEYIKGDPTMNGYLSRTSDKFIELADRSEIARKHKADLLISIHADSAANSAATGASILVLSNQRASRENSKLEKDKNKHKDLLSGAGEVISENGTENPYFASMILDLTSDHARTEGYKLATEILYSLGKGIHLHHKNPIYRSLAVLKAPDIPSLLIETGYLSNADEERLLKTDKYQREVAYAIYRGIKEYTKKNPLTKSEVSQETRKEYTKEFNGEYFIYIVKKGDYLSKIAEKFGVSAQEIKKLNNMKKDQVNLGQKIKIPGKP